MSELKPFLAEPVLTAIVQNRLESFEVVAFASLLVQKVNFKVRKTAFDIKTEN